MNNETREKLQENTPRCTIFTKELIRRKILVDPSEFEIELFDTIFKELLMYYEYRVILICCSYTISCIKRNDLKDEENKPIESLYAYFKVALLSNIKRYTRPVDIDWLE
nr:hypothetical protein [Bacilli bacterium]